MIAGQLHRGYPGALVAGLLLLAIGFGFSAGGAAAQTSVGDPPHAAAAVAKRPAAGTAVGKRRAAWKARERRVLKRMVRRAPGIMFKRSFMRRAQRADFTVPLTVRVRPGSQMAVTMLPNRRPLDELTYPIPADPQPLDLAGQFTMEVDFSAGPGYGGLGNFQGRTGGKTSMWTTSPLRFAEFDCGPAPPDPRPAFLETTPDSTSKLTSGGTSWTDLNPFSGEGSGTLYLNFTVSSRVRRVLSPGPAACDTPGDTADFLLPTQAGLPSEGGLPSITPARVDWSGKFRIAPAITADGRLRFGKIEVDSSVTPQPVSAGNIWACAPQAAVTGIYAPTGLAPCLETSAPLDPVMEPAGPTPFTAQFQFTRLSADVLLGDVPPPPTP